MSFSVPWGYSRSLSHRPERDFFNAFTASWSGIQPSFQLTCYWVILFIYSNDTASPTSVPAVSACWNGLQSLQSNVKYLYPESFQHQLNLSLNLQSSVSVRVVTRTVSFSQIKMEQRLILMLKSPCQVCHVGHNVFLMFQQQTDL